MFREHKLAVTYRSMKWRFTAEELCSLPQDLDAKATTLAAIRNLGRMPQRHPKATEEEPELLAEHRLATSLKHFRTVNKLTAEEEQELGHLEAAGLEDATAAPDPDEKFAAEAANRLDQTLLMLSDGICTKAVLQRARTYKRLLAKPGAHLTQWAQTYGQRIEAAVIQGGALQPAALPCYTPGREIAGDELRTFSAAPVISGPLVCQLCTADFAFEGAFLAHKKQCHGGEAEYRKRVLFLLAEEGYRAITGQEKRLMVQNFAHFQQYSHPGAKGNIFSRAPAVPRCEAACAICGVKDWIEHRHRLNLFADPPPGSTSEETRADDPVATAPGGGDEDGEDDGRRDAPKPATQQIRALAKKDGVYYIQSPAKVQRFLSVERYLQRWGCNRTAFPGGGATGPPAPAHVTELYPPARPRRVN